RFNAKNTLAKSQSQHLLHTHTTVSCTPNTQSLRLRVPAPRATIPTYGRRLRFLSTAKECLIASNLRRSRICSLRVSASHHQHSFESQARFPADHLEIYCGPQRHWAFSAAVLLCSCLSSVG
ncbi:hypothetical protein CF328_g9505, partial [Tilletia controversa]